jgi:hypothetical protein
VVVGRPAFIFSKDQAPPMKSPLALLALLAPVVLLPLAAHAQSTPPPVAAETPSAPPALEPFKATYEAFYKGKQAGSASMGVVQGQGRQWRMDLAVRGERGFAGILGMNLEQSTVFENDGGHYRPLSQSTVRKGLFLGKKVTGVYDWTAHVARWSGDLKKDRTQPVPLQDGDLSALLINLAIMRDAQPGRTMHYRFVDGGRTREHVYQVAEQTEIVPVGDLSYDAMRVSRTNGGKNETILWVANGVPTPIRILQREDGEDRVDLRLVEYTGN